MLQILFLLYAEASPELGVLPATGDARVVDLVDQPQDVAVLTQREGGLALVRREIALHVAQARGERRRADRRVADGAETFRSEPGAELQSEVVVAGLLCRLLEQQAVLAEVELVERALEIACLDGGPAEDGVGVAAVALYHLRHAAGSRGQHLRWWQRRLGVRLRHDTIL